MGAQISGHKGVSERPIEGSNPAQIATSLPRSGTAPSVFCRGLGRQTLERDQSMAGIRMRSTTETETLETENGAR